MLSFMKKLSILLLVLTLTSCGALENKQRIDDDVELQQKLASIDISTVDKSLYSSAVTAMDNGEYFKSGQLFKQLIANSPENPVYQMEYAKLARKTGNCSPALNALDALIEMKPKELALIEIREEKALCLLSLGKFQKAGVIFTEIINQDSSRWKSINGAGLIFAIKKKFSEANQYFDLAAEVSDYNPVVLNNQGLTKAIMGNNKDAIKLLRDAALQSADSLEQKRRIHLNLALVYGISGNSEMAKNTAKNYLTEPQLFNNLGVYAELAKNPELARTYLNKALSGAKVYYDKAWENLERVEGSN